MSKVLFLISPSLNAFADRRKGTTGNKIDCAFQHYKNSTVSNLQIGALAGATALIGKSSFNAAVKNAPELAAQLQGKGIITKFMKYLNAAPKPIKIAAGILAGLSLLKRTYNKGKIEQKYLDRAQFVDHTYNLDGEGSKAAAKLSAKASAPLKK